MPGEGMKEPSRKMTRMPRVKRSLFLKSGVLKALRIAPIKRPPRWRMKSQSRGRDLANETNTSKTRSGYDPQVETDEGRRGPIPYGDRAPPAGGGYTEGGGHRSDRPLALKPRSRSAGADQASVALPPAALIFSAAEPENLSAVMFRATVISPVPRTFTGCFGRTAPLATRSATVTSPPSGNRADSLSRLTTWNVTFVGFLNPRSFGRRMCIGVWPPSQPCGTW